MKKERRLYDSVRWRKFASAHKAAFPLCILCERQGRTTACQVTDHIKPHNGDPELFWDWDNLQSLCPTCHSGIKAMQDHHGYSQACDADGNPIDHSHPWNKERKMK